MLRAKSFQMAAAVTLALGLTGLSHSASAEPVYERTCWSAELSTIFHQVSGTVTIVDRETMYVESFTYDGGGPAVYFYLGATNSNSSFANGLAVPPLLSGTVYSGDSLTLTLPPGETLDRYGAISVWCEDFNVNFGSGSFQPGPPAGDVDCDCDVDLDDYDLFATCLAGPDDTTPPPGCTASEFDLADTDGDGDVDLVDVAGFQQAFGRP